MTDAYTSMQAMKIKKKNLFLVLSHLIIPIPVKVYVGGDNISRKSLCRGDNINKRNMEIYMRIEKYNEIHLTKNKMCMNRKTKNQTGLTRAPADLFLGSLYTPQTSG